MNMLCSTIEVNRNGKRVIMNLSDFDLKTMTKWGDISGSAINITSPAAAVALTVPPPPAAVKIQ